MKYKTKKVTKERLNQADHYRAQVQLPDKRVWAILYGSVYDRNSELASQLRDHMGLAVATTLIDHYRTLLSEPAFRAYLRQWVAEQVDSELQPMVWKWLRERLGEDVS